MRLQRSDDGSLCSPRKSSDDFGLNELPEEFSFVVPGVRKLNALTVVPQCNANESALGGLLGIDLPNHSN